MNIQNGEHQNSTLSMGVEAHLVRHAGSSKWKIKTLDASWGIETGWLNTKTWFAERMGLADMEFNTPAEAYAFLEQHVKFGPAAALHS